VRKSLAVRFGWFVMTGVNGERWFFTTEHYDRAPDVPEYWTWEMFANDDTPVLDGLATYHDPTALLTEICDAHNAALPPAPRVWTDEERQRVAQCPEPYNHEVFRYCPACPWTEDFR
jgi:hypothetical protein